MLTGSFQAPDLNAAVEALREILPAGVEVHLIEDRYEAVYNRLDRRRDAAARKLQTELYVAALHSRPYHAEMARALELLEDHRFMRCCCLFRVAPSEWAWFMKREGGEG